MSKDDDYMAIVLEDIRDQNKVIAEAVDAMQDKIETLATKEELQAAIDDSKAIKYTLADTNYAVNNHERRITALEKAA